MTTTPKKKKVETPKVVEPKRNAMGRIIEEPTRDYKLSLQIGKETFASDGVTMLEALQGLQKPEKLMAKSILTISVGKDKRDLYLTPARAKRLFYNSRGVAEVIAKQLATGLLK